MAIRSSRYRSPGFEDVNRAELREASYTRLYCSIRDDLHHVLALLFVVLMQMDCAVLG